MQCACGGSCELRRSVRSNLDAVFKYWKCPSCGRIEPDVLTVEGEVVARGWDAKTRYTELPWQWGDPWPGEDE